METDIDTRATQSPTLLVRLSNWFDVLSKPANIRRVERAIINFALLGFALHLLLIFLAQHSPLGQSVLRQVPGNYLKAIYTPFSIILFYEVLMLIVILPRSIANFIGKQYEIITLITIRSFFHDIAEYDLDKPEIYTLEFLGDISLDLVGALLMFFLTTLYYRVSAQTRKAKADPSSKRARIVHIKKVAALVLTVLLLLLSVVSFTGWLQEIYHVSITDGVFPDPNVVFYKEFFSVMIFVDVFLLILSFIYSGTYDLIFRNAGFVISTILVRVAMTAEKPFTIYFALTALLFGVLLLALFVFYNQKSATESESLDDDGD